MGVLLMGVLLSAPVCECGGEGRNGHPTQEVVPYGQYQNSNARWTRHGPQGLLSIGRLAVLWYESGSAKHLIGQDAVLVRRLTRNVDWQLTITECELGILEGGDLPWCIWIVCQDI